MVGLSFEIAMIGIFLAGIALVLWSVEVFIEAVARSAVSLGVSGFFLAVILAGVDLENAILGVAAAYAALPDLALGTVFGEAIFVLAVAVGLAGLLVPFETEVPRLYLLLTVLAPVPMFLLSLGGSLSVIEGALLAIVFPPLLFLIYGLETRAETRYMVPGELDELIDLDEGEEGEEDENEGELLEALESLEEALVPDLEGRSGSVQLGVAIVAVVGMTAGSGIAVTGAEGVLAAFGLSGLAFGATVMSFIASIEELFLTVEPARQGRPHIAVGNVVGSTLFYVTANAGVIALLHPVSTVGPVLSIHWPFFFATLAVVAWMLARGRTTRIGGVVLLCLYAAYWVANYA